MGEQQFHSRVFSIEKSRKARKIIQVLPEEIRNKPENIKAISKKSSSSSKAKDEFEAIDNFPGMKNILKPNSSACYKTTWWLIILMSSCLCCYQILERLLFFVSKPIISDITIVRNASLVFPAFTVCPAPNNYPLLLEAKKDFAKKYNLTNHCSVSHFDLMKNGWSIEQLWENMHMIKHSISGIFQMLSLHKGGGNIFEVEERNVRLPMGTCVRYTIPGLIPFKGEDVYLAAVATSSHQECVKNDIPAISVFIDEPDDDSNYYSKTPITVNYYKSLKFSLTVNEFKAISTKTRPCTTREANKKCKINCLQNILRNKVFCSLPFMDVPDLKPCSKNTIENASKIFSFEISKLDFINDCKCHKKCEEVLYKINLNNFDMNVNGLGVVTISFADNTINKVQELYSYTIIALFCDIGGNLGLFLGLCFTEILEIFEGLFLQILKRFIKCK